MEVCGYIHCVALFGNRLRAPQKPPSNPTRRARKIAAMESVRIFPDDDPEMVSGKEAVASCGGVRL